VESGERKKHFWHPPLWKWALVLALLGCAEFLFLWRRPAAPVKVELLPFTDLPPAWDGSQPWMVISPIAGDGAMRFKVAIEMVKPSVRHDAPVNDFVVNLRNGNFKLRQTDLFAGEPQASRLDAAVDEIHDRFGTTLLTRASLLPRTLGGTGPPRGTRQR